MSFHIPNVPNSMSSVFPPVGELVRVRIKEANRVAIIATLVDFPDLEGWMKLPERSPNVLAQGFRIGLEGMARVIRVDETKGYIDLCIKSFERIRLIRTRIAEIYDDDHDMEE